MSKMEKNGMEKLAKVLDSRMGEHSGGGFSFDFGVIKKDYSLVSNTFPLPIPKKDYSVCRLLANLSTNVSGGTHGGHNSGTGSHSHKVVMPKLKPGDRVLIVWVEGEPVVVDVHLLIEAHGMSALTMVVVFSEFATTTILLVSRCACRQGIIMIKHFRTLLKSARC